MRKQGNSAALILVATGLLMVTTGCETSKHAEVMGAESFEAKQQMAAMEEADSGGIPLENTGISQSSLTGSGLPPASGFAPDGPPGATLRGLDLSPQPGGDSLGQESGEEMIFGRVSDAVAPTGTRTLEDSGPYPSGNRSPAAGFGPEGPALPTFGDESPYGSVTESMDDSMETTQPIASADPDFNPGATGYEGQEFENAMSPPSGFMPSTPPYPTFGQEPSNEVETVVAVPDMAVPDVPEPPSMGATESMPLDSGDMEMAPEVLTEIADVFFDFDKYSIRSDAAATLVQNARILQNELHGSRILVEGHCDERGTEEYNMVLGERRAQSVKSYLVDLGIPASSIQIVSYGKERPFCTEHYDSCWEQNRRGHFVIQ